MALIDALNKEWQKKINREWNQIYIAVDLHDTVLKSDYTGTSTEVIPESIECLSYLSSRKDIILILWTASHADDIRKYREMLSKHGIHFDAVNENPFEMSNKLSDFVSKFYANLYFDDKAGFIASDFQVVLDFFKAHT